MPVEQGNWRLGGSVSTLVHIAIILLLLAPVGYGGLITPIEQGAGGPGPAGGGGGRSAARMEVVQFVPVSPPPKAAPKPVVPVFKPVIQAITPPPMEQLKVPEPVALGTTTGSAPDPNGGAGPGTGGGVGAGDGKGKGSSIGPGTGGGNGENYPPTTNELFIPPLPVPASARGFHIIAEFDVDERGRVLKLDFTQTPDRGYNKRLADVLKGYKFRPGTRQDGTPIRMKAQISIDLP